MNEILTEYNDIWIEKRADPFVYKHSDGYYYFTASVPTFDKIILRRAKSLSEMPEADEIIIWEKHTTGIMGHHIWAPEIHYLFGKWYIYFAAGEAENIWNIRPYVLECTGNDPMHDAWIEKGIMKAADDDEFSFHSFSLDATVFEHLGRYYYIWAEKTGVGKAISNLYIAEMESPVKLKTTQVLLTTPDYDWERIGFWVNEGPAVLKRNGKIFLTYSASATGACYCMGLLTANEDSDLLDPSSWVKERYPVLKTDSEKGIFGPGHNSFTKSLDGKDIMVFHARQYEEIVGDPLKDPNRHAMLMEITWSEEGKPIFEYQKNSANLS
ncbi:glycoside hydrolase family 43 protein [Clostridium sp. Marseille-P299]|uniref:glycoside hydrolase family 43 protein n=1 Tax=Clostridium sp. Marseille-P299 TaxID=1805477 RepID=UPI000830D21D|nr:family 43 glycosylhydrolase [Clostridium sp. Marseille-P299]